MASLQPAYCTAASDAVQQLLRRSAAEGWRRAWLPLARVRRERPLDRRPRHTMHHFHRPCSTSHCFSRHLLWLPLPVELIHGVSRSVVQERARLCTHRRPPLREMLGGGVHRLRQLVQECQSVVPATQRRVLCSNDNLPRVKTLIAQVSTDASVVQQTPECNTTLVSVDTCADN